MLGNKEKKREYIRKNYKEVALKGATGGGCCCSPGCCGTDSMDISNEAAMRIGYSENDLLNSPTESNMGLGCGNPIAIASLKLGETVLDLGSGGGLDCFLASKQVGKNGLVIGVDMTPEMVQLARENAEKNNYENVEFRLGEIEHLPVADATVDVIISNCVINLSVDKGQIFKDAYRVLKKGGRLSISDIVSTVILSDELRNDLNMVASCIGGAEYIEELKDMLTNAGFQNIQLTKKDNSSDIIKSWFPQKDIEQIVASYVIEATK